MRTRHSFLAAAVVSASIACTDIDEQVSGVLVDPAITSLQLATHAAEADTSARILVRATAARGSNGERPLVTFTASAGSFTVDGKPQVAITTMVDESNNATVLLRPSPSPALAVVRASTGTHYQQDTIRFVVSGLRELHLDRDSIAADGTSLGTLRATVSRAAIGVNRDVIFMSSAGSFIGAAGSARTVTADTGNVAIAQLQVPRDAGVLYVQASSGGVTLRDSIHLLTALPDRLEISAPSLVTADQSTTATITARVMRSTGLPDPRTQVAFSTTKPDGTPYGILGLASAMSEDGQIAVSFVSSDTTYSGPLVITARTQGTSGLLQTLATMTVKPK